MAFDEFAIHQCAISFADPFEIIGIRPIGGIGNQAVFHWVCMDVTAKVEQVGEGLNRLCAETPFKKYPALTVSFVVGFGITVENGLRHDPRRHIPILATKEMIVIGFQAIGDHGDIVCLALP